MKIEKITFCNLTSFAGQQEIDFTTEPLRSASLFAITGDTGAGKSTILDAICLALYNDAPRMDAVEKMKAEELEIQGEGELKAIQARDARNLMRRGEREAMSAVTFSLPDGSRYEATWQCRLKRTGNHDSVQRALRQIAPRRRDIAVGATSVVQPRIDELVGLDYQQFSHTVMLAQNSFAMFLQATKHDKSRLLEKLTGTEIYGEISQRIHERTEQADKRVSELENLIRGILHDRLTEPQLNDVRTELTRRETMAQHLAEQATRQEKQLHWLADYAVAEKEVEKQEADNIAARQRLNALRHEELELERYDAVLPVQALFEETRVRLKDIDNLKAQDDTALARLTEGRKEQLAATVALTNSKEKAAQTEEQLQERLPIIQRGYTIQGEITEATEQVRKLEQQLLQAQQLLEDRRRRLGEKRARQADVEKQIGELQNRHDALAVHRGMFDKIDLIKDKLNSLRAESEQNRLDRKDCGEQQTRQRDLATSLRDLEQRQQAAAERLASLKGELLIHTQTNQGRDGQALNREVGEHRSRIAALRHAANLWQRLAKGYEEIDAQRAKIARDVNHIEQLRRDLQRAATQLAAREEVFQHLNEAYMLSNSENIRRLRAALKEGTACPVCGATHHPYHTETEQEREAHGQLGELMDRLEKDYNEARLERDRTQTDHDALQQQIAQAEGELNAERENLRRLQLTQAADEAEWQDYAYLDPSFAECSGSVDAAARRTLLGLLADNARRDEAQAAADLKTFNYHQDLITSLSAQIDKVTTELDDARRQHDTLSTDEKIANSRIETLQQRIARSDRACGQLYRDLDELMELSEWFADWKNNPDNFRVRLNEMLADWTGTTAALEEQQRVALGLREEVRTAEDNEQEAGRQLVAAGDERDAAKERLDAKHEELRRLFGKEQPKEEEQRLRGYADKAAVELEEARKAYETVNSRLNKLEGEHRNLEASRQRKQEEYGKKMSELDLWMNRFNMDHSPLQYIELEKIFSNPRDWKALRDRLAGHHREVTLASHRLDEARRRLMELQAVAGRPTGQGNETAEALTAALAATRERQKETDALVLNLKTTIQAHENSGREADRRQAELDTARDDAQEWNRLDTLLGSASGKKFRELAQTYTFRYLVECANHHLRRLSPRYELRALPGSLMLDVIDRDMFDERRYASSLSGGETFVVSLALALGLASLSAGNLNIGSLFIDEGFGNLDRESLDLVMETLSNLEDAQGRKVGVISHTEQIRRQIQPQIRVRKVAAGRSTIEVR